MKKRIALLLALLCLLSMLGALPLSAAEMEDVGKKGSGGSGVSWTLSDNGTLTVSGKGVFTGVGAKSWRNNVQQKATSCVVKEGITGIGADAFREFGITDISLPDSLTSIGDNAFLHCNRLETVSLPKKLTSIGRGAFYSCAALKEINIPEGVTALSSAFAQCSSLESVRLPSSLTYLSFAFQGCASLKSIALPAGITMMGGSFQNCTSLKTLTVPASVTSVSCAEFEGCTALKSVLFEGDAPAMVGWVKIDGVVYENLLVLNEIPGLVVEYYRGSSGWGSTLGGVKTRAVDAPAGSGYAETAPVETTAPAPETEPAPPAKWENPFSDVSEQDGCYDAVRYVYENALFKGTSDSAFSPDGSMTRAMFVTVLGRLAGVDGASFAGSAFADVAEGQWFTPYVAWASENGIVSGYSADAFGPEDPVTIEQALVILARYRTFDRPHRVCGVPKEDAFSAYADGGAVSDWAKNAVFEAISEGIYPVAPGREIRPGAQATRADVAGMLYQLSKLR